MITEDKSKWELINRHELTFVSREDIIHQLKRMGYRMLYNGTIQDGNVAMFHCGYVMPRTDRTSAEMWFGKDYDRLIEAARSLTDDDGGLVFAEIVKEVAR